MADDDAPMDRRKFFRRGLAELLRPVARAISPIEKVAKKIGDLDPPPPPPPPPVPQNNRIPLGLWLRPPGAIAEKDFIQTCDRSGQCVQACPAHCIVIDPTGVKGRGAAYIDADTSACVVCDGLYCMRVCPTQALLPTSINDIDMGTAVWREETCELAAGHECRICVDQCPLGETAIRFENNTIAVQPLGCIGCGVCQNVCPTTPKSIVVIPKAAKERA
jgi:ferredoxin-type protein NapG